MESEYPEPDCPKPDCDGTLEYKRDVPTNTGPTAIDPNYRAVFECNTCDHGELA